MQMEGGCEQGRYGTYGRRTWRKAAHLTQLPQDFRQSLSQFLLNVIKSAA